MGRTKYSDEDRNRIIINFLRCTREIIDTEGIEHVSIRKVSQRAGFNSATLYLYFKDADELITLASMGYLENYCRTMVADAPKMNTPEDIYLHTWRVFGLHAFAHPQAFYRMFFYPHSLPLHETVARYYEIYPNLLGEVDGSIREMLQQGELTERNLQVLLPLAQKYGMEASEINMVNDLTVCYFKMLLEEHGPENEPVSSEAQVQRLMDVISFLFRKTGKAG